MPIHTLSSVLGDATANQLVLGAGGLFGLVSLKAWSGGRKCTWERHWAGKMILIVAPPTTTILSLMETLLHLPSPPQILFLPPLPSPLPESLLTLLQALRLGLKSPQAQLHCDPLPRSPSAIRDFVSRYTTAPTGMAGEGGRRIDSIILGSGWEVEIPPPKIQGEWTLHEYHFHFLTAILPHLLRQPAERNIRIVSMISPVWSAALPTLEGKPTKAGRRSGLVQITASRSITTMLMMRQYQLVLDTLASAAYSKGKASGEVPKGEDEETVRHAAKKRDKDVKSNVKCVGVIMPWTRGEVVGGWTGIDDNWWRWIVFVLLYPIIILFTPSPRASIQSILFALSAPVRYGPLTPPIPRPIQPGQSGATTPEETTDPRRAGVQGGDIVRDCAVVDIPPVLSDPELCKITYNALEKAVEKGIKAEKAKQPKTA